MCLTKWAKCDFLGLFSHFHLSQSQFSNSVCTFTPFVIICLYQRCRHRMGHILSWPDFTLFGGAREQRVIFSALKVSQSVLATQSCLTLQPMDCGPPGFSVHGILQTKILDWAAIAFSKRSSRPRDRTCGSWIAGRFFTIWSTSKACSEGHGPLIHTVQMVNWCAGETFLEKNRKYPNSLFQLFMLSSL